MKAKEARRLIVDNGGIGLWAATTDHGRVPHKLTAYRVNKTVLILEDYGELDGWELYEPVSSSNNVQTTLAAAKLVE